MINANIKPIVSSTAPALSACNQNPIKQMRKTKAVGCDVRKSKKNPARFGSRPRKRVIKLAYNDKK